MRACVLVIQRKNAGAFLCGIVPHTASFVAPMKASGHLNDLDNDLDA